MLLLFFCIRLFHDLPSPNRLALGQSAASSIIYDRKGEVLYYFYGDQHRIPVPLSQISQPAIDATLAIEDQEFHHHFGFSIKGMLRALRNNFLKNSATEGGSTITQQLVKNRLLSREKRIARKIKELVLAIWVELLFTKKEILEMYLNDASYGGTAHGIEAAARKYFDKPASSLTVPESALLAGLLKAPTLYSPFGSRPALAASRQKHVLRRMYEENYISYQQFQDASETELDMANDAVKIVAPHFVMYVKSLLVENFGQERLNTGGLRIKTTLDLSLQLDTQERVTKYVRRLFRYRVKNGAALITNPRTGEILSMVGSADYFDSAIDGQVNVVLQYRQPGSAIKPLTYAMSLEGGKTAMSMLDDRPVEYEIPNEGIYKPRNDDYTFRGDVTLREALASSYNIPAINELASLGVLNFVEKAKEVGITNWTDQNEYRVALTLGSGEVRMLDMAQLYSTFANDGSPIVPNPLLEIAGLDGGILYKNNCAFSQQECNISHVFSADTAFLINSILSDNKSRSVTFGPSSDLYIHGHQVAVKTGTTNFLRDNWAIGYTSERLVAVWMGNNDGAPMRFIHSGAHGASTIWNGIMNNLLVHSKRHRFHVPDSIVRLEVCPETGTLACADCETVIEEYFAAGTEPLESCDAMAAGP